MKIKSLKALQIINSRAVPTIKTIVFLEDGTKGEASVPQGASTGKLEAKELRDNDKSQFLGLSVGENIKFIESEINNHLRGVSINDQEKIDRILIELDGTPNKGKLGANTLLSVSLACARAGANSQRMELFEYIGKMCKNKSFKMPIPLFNIINGGKHSENNLEIQEFLVIPSKTSSLFSGIKAGVEIYLTLKEILKERQLNTNLGDEGGFAPALENNKEALVLIKEAIEKSNNSKNVVLGLDVASSSFFQKDSNQYIIENIPLSSEQLLSYLKDLTKEFGIKSIEDPLADEDIKNWPKAKKILENVQIVGDDLFVTNKEIVEERHNLATAIIIKPNQIGTLTETLDTIKTAKSHNLKIIISHRSGETEDDFIADLAVGIQADMIKSGSVARSERLSKYNRLLEIEKFYNFPYQK